MQFDETLPLAFLSQGDFEIDFEDNGWFSLIDSAVTAAFMRLRKPSRVVEVGSGFSTKAIRQGYTGTLVCIDPAPQADIESLASLHIKARVETVSVDIFEDTDVLFIDSSHIWQAGDLPFLYEKAFDRLKPGSLVHSHDIFLPEDYPPGWKPRGYNEQYMLKAYLKKNDNWTVLWPGYYMATRFPAACEQTFGTAFPAGSLWMVKCS